MSSDLFLFDGSFFSDPFSPYSDSPIDPLHSIPDNNGLIQLQDSSFSPNFFSLSNSPPSHQFQNLSLCQTTQLENVSDSATQFEDYSVLDVKTEDTQFPLDLPYDYHHHQSFGPHSYSGAENVGKMMQRSYSSSCFDGKPSFLFQPRFDSLLETPNFQTQMMSSPEESFSSGQMRRVCSTGDLQKIQTSQGGSQRLCSSSLATESSFMEDASFKVGRYSAEERRERIHKYRAKRTQRNFNKTIKYACRKTLADNRPRVRGRFARNDETEDAPKGETFNRYEDEDDISWIDGFNEVDEEKTIRSGGSVFCNDFGPRQIQYYGYS